MASSEPSTSMLPEEDSDLIMRFHKLPLTVKCLHLSGLLSLQKSDCVSLVESMPRLSMDHNFEKGIFCLLFEVLS